MLTIATITISITLVILACAVGVVLFRKNQKKQLKEMMIRHLEEAKSQVLKISDRMMVQVINHQVHFIQVKDHGLTRTYVRYQDLLDTEEVSIKEREQMDAIIEHLGSLRKFKSAHVNKPKGFVTHLDVVHGKILQYTPGLKTIGNRNMMAVLLKKNSSGAIFVREIHMSYNLGQEMTHKIEIADDHGNIIQSERDRFKDQFVNNEDRYMIFEEEITRYNQLVVELRKYNLHRDAIDMDPITGTMEYRGIKQVDPNTLIDTVSMTVEDRPRKLDYGNAENISLETDTPVMEFTDEEPVLQ
jgi:hypothetical protein